MAGGIDGLQVVLPNMRDLISTQPGSYLPVLTLVSL